MASPDPAPAGGASGSAVRARLVLQQCVSAKLQVEPADPHTNTSARFVQINRGLVVYVCFLKGSTLETVDKMVKSSLNTRLSTNDEGKLVSISDLPGDLLVVPQATLGGKLKGKVMQYHMNIDKATGLELYQAYVRQCTEIVSTNKQFVEKECSIQHGTYGNLQVLQMDTNGPFSHLIEIL